MTEQVAEQLDNLKVEETNEETNEVTNEDTANGEERKGMFADISADNNFTELESLCMNCYENGVTRLLLTRIPHFKDIIIMAFSCPHCHFRSNEVQSGGMISEKGEKLELHVTEKSDVNRQIVKSESATIRIPELDFEIPATTQRGSLKTIEGFLMQTVDALRDSQKDRALVDPEVAIQVGQFIEKLEAIATGETLPFTIILDDPAGNSFIENPHAPQPDPKVKVTRYSRTVEQDTQLGLTSNETPESQALKDFSAKKDNKYELDFDKFNHKEQVMIFNGNCSQCNAPSETRMFAIEIPYFKEVIIMASSCEYCGYKSSECKAGGAISKRGKRLTLRVESVEDLNRDILKSETATVYVPEKDLHITRGTLGGRFTTVEGLLAGIKDDLSRTSGFISGDSGDEEIKKRFEKFLSDMEDLIEGREPFTLILEDPVANSYILSLYAPDPDPQLSEEEYDRTWDEDEELGLNDINTENYREGEE
ncbi:ZPR1-type zinc finger-containing protein [Planoprotostelium fungivorum]|uniref:ZPR1-type zinc finger-containing protein n=1 Tax=Planoprotostelium fungivorum TaxID=1890364 RepID=A0A2P6N3Z3_9EUKA|nr:ZPR1-type zinc finger-containing protein [Planoprotostelium fungivorum]